MHQIHRKNMPDNFFNRYKRFIRYCIVGAAGTAVDVVSLYIFVEHLKLGVIFAAVISFILAVANNYYFNKIWTFENKSKKYKSQLIKFFAVSVIGLALNTIGMIFFIYVTGIYYIAAKLLTSVVVLTWNFMGNRYWTFFEEIPRKVYDVSAECDISIIVPAYNEEKRILGTLMKISDFFDKKGLSYEIIVVDDGSSDNTVEIIEKSGINKLRVIASGKNMGKGYSVKTGMLGAKGRYTLFTDADNSTPIEEFDKIHPFFGKYKVIIGSRYIKSSDVRIKQPLYRRFVSRLGNILIRNILFDNINDTQCGFKAFELSAARNIFKRVTVKRFGFDIEALAISKMLKYEVKEVGVNWINDPVSRVHIIKDSIRTFIDLIYVKLNVWAGRYR